MINPACVAALEQECRALFTELTSLQDKIREKLSAFADGKTLKGNELVGWLGEIYGKLLLNGTLVHDREEHDFVCADGSRVSVKTRKGFGTGWQKTSAIPKLDGPQCPTHLLFVHLNEDYSVDRIWLFPWTVLAAKERFKSHTVRGSHRSFIFTLDEKKDKGHVIYGADGYPLQASPAFSRRSAQPLSVHKEKALIQHEGMFLDFIARRGVGSKDVVASSPASYISYLNSVANLIGREVSPALLRTEGDVLNIAGKISGQRAKNTIRNYCSAMRQYVAMVEAMGL